MRRIFDWRNARQAIELANGGREGIETLERNPQLGQILVELHRAQQPGLTLDDVLSDLRRHADDAPAP